MGKLDKLTPEGFNAQMEALKQDIDSRQAQTKVENEITTAFFSELEAAVQTKVQALSSRLGDIDLLKFKTGSPGNSFTVDLQGAVTATATVMRSGRYIFADLVYRAGLASYRTDRYAHDYAQGDIDSQSTKLLEVILDFPKPEDWDYWE